MTLTKKQLLARDMGAELLLSKCQLSAGESNIAARIDTSTTSRAERSDANARRFPRVVVFAGPNGAGKSTHADAILAALGIETFVNADFIARGLSGRNTDAVAFEAGRIMLKRLRQLADAKADFAFESTLSSRTFALFLRTLKEQGYALVIYYFSLGSAQLAVRRVKLRVILGGHDVPANVVQRRFGRSLSNFFTLYAPLADEWTLFDNSGEDDANPIATQSANKLTITEAITWQKLKKLSKTF